MSSTAKFSASWVPRTVAFSLQSFYEHIVTGEVALLLPREFKIADIVPADTVAAAGDAAHLTQFQRALLVAGAAQQPLQDLALPPLRLTLDGGSSALSQAAYDAAEAAFFLKLGVDAGAADLDPILLLLMRLFFVDNSPLPQPPPPARPSCLPPPPQIALQEGPEGEAARAQFSRDVLHLPLPCKIETPPRPPPRICEKQVSETRPLLLSFEGAQFELAGGIPLEPMFCSGVLVSRSDSGNGEFLSETFHFDATDEELLRRSSGDSVTFHPLTRHKDVLLQMSSLPDTSVWLVVIVEKSMGFHTQKPYLESGGLKIEDLQQRFTDNCKLYGKYRRPFVWGYTQIYSRNAPQWLRNPLDLPDESDDVHLLSSPTRETKRPLSHNWQLGDFEIPDLYLVSDFCENFSRPFSIFDSMNRIDSKRKQYKRVGGILRFVLQPWSGSDFSTPGRHQICVIADSSRSEGQILDCFLYRPKFSFSEEEELPSSSDLIVFSAHESLLHSHMNCFRCYDRLVNSLYLHDMSINLQDVKFKRSFGERDNYVLRVCFKEGDNDENDGIVPAMVMKSSSSAAMSTHSYTHVVMDVSHPHFLDEFRIELRPQLHPKGHLLITLMRVARRSKLSTLSKNAPSIDEKSADMIIGHAVLPFCSAAELATCCTKGTSLPLIEHPLRPGYLKYDKNQYLASEQRVFQCKLHLESSVFPSTLPMARLFTSLCSFHELSFALRHFINRGSCLSLSCARRDLESEIRQIMNDIVQLTASVDLLEIVAFFPAVSTCLIHVLCCSHYFYLYEKNREDPFAATQPLGALWFSLSRQSLQALMYFVSCIASRNAEYAVRKAQMVPETPVSHGIEEAKAVFDSNDTESDESDESLAPNILWFVHRIYDDSATFAATGRSSSAALSEVWSRSLQEKLSDVISSAQGPTQASFINRQTLSSKVSSTNQNPVLAKEVAILNKESTCSMAWFMFALIRKSMLLHLERSGLTSDGFAPNSSHPVRKMLVELSYEIINTLSSFMLVSFVDDWPDMKHEEITNRCFKHMVLFIRDCGAMFGSAFVVTSMQSILLKIKQHTDPDPRSIFSYKAQIGLLKILYNTPHILILNRLATLDMTAAAFDPILVLRHCGHFALLCTLIDSLQNVEFDESNYRISYSLAWDVLARLDSNEFYLDRELRAKIAVLFWPLLCSILSLYHQNIVFHKIWSQPFYTKIYVMCLFIIANVPRTSLIMWLKKQTDRVLIAFIDLLKDTFFIVSPVYTNQKDAGEDSQAMLMSALTILSFVVLSPELGSDMPQEPTKQPEKQAKPKVTRVDVLMGISSDASDSSLWCLLNIFYNIMDVVTLRRPSVSLASADARSNQIPFSWEWESLRNRCFQAIKCCALRFDLLVASSDSVELQFVKPLLEDQISSSFRLSTAQMFFIDTIKKYISVIGLSINDWHELFLLSLQNICSSNPEFADFGLCFHRLLSENIPGSLQDNSSEFHYKPASLEDSESLVLDPDSKAFIPILAGSVDSLIQVLVSRAHPANTATFRKFFFMWYCLKPLKISTVYLMKCLCFELELAFSESRIPDVIHIVGLFLAWFEDYVDDFDACLLSRLVDSCIKWRPLFLALCNFDFSRRLLLQLYRKLAEVLKSLKQEIDSRHHAPKEPDQNDLDVTKSTQNDATSPTSDASQLLAMALAVAVGEVQKTSSSPEVDEVSMALHHLSLTHSSATIDAAHNALDGGSVCTCILTELDPKDIASILTKCFFDTFYKIPPREFAKKLLGERADRWPNLNQAIKNTEKLSLWIRCMVLMEGRLEFRRKLCSHFIQVCNYFLEFNDFNGLMATINGGLGSTPIHRLKKTLGCFTYKDDEKVPREESDDFDFKLAEMHFNAKTVMSTDKNFTNYRQRLEKCDLPCFPYVGTFLTDATFAWDGKGEKPMKFPESCIDIRRPTKCAGIVMNNLSMYQSRQYTDLVVNPEAQAKLMSTFNAPLFLKLGQLQLQNQNTYDEYCIILSKNIESEERKQPLPFPTASASIAAPSAATAAQQPAGSARASASPNSVPPAAAPPSNPQTVKSAATALANADGASVGASDASRADSTRAHT